MIQATFLEVVFPQDRYGERRPQRELFHLRSSEGVLSVSRTCAYGRGNTGSTLKVEEGLCWDHCAARACTMGERATGNGKGQRFAVQWRICRNGSRDNPLEGKRVPIKVLSHEAWFMLDPAARALCSSWPTRMRQSRSAPWLPGRARSCSLPATVTRLTAGSATFSQVTHLK